MQNVGVSKLAALYSAIDTFATHHLPLIDAPDAYAHFQRKEQGMIKVVFNP